jgi:hypothetical protein
MEFFSGAFHAQEAKNLEALKKLIEENKTDYYPAPIDTLTEETVLEAPTN